MMMKITVDDLHSRRTWTSYDAARMEAWENRARQVENTTFTDRDTAESAARELFGQCCVEDGVIWNRSPTAPLNGAIGVMLGTARRLGAIFVIP